MSDSEYEEEEFLVYADFKNQLLTNEISDPNAAIKIIGIESKNPIAEINGNIFKGTYDFAMGTNVFFEKDNEAIPADPLFEASCKQKYRYFDKTNKVINFQCIYVEKKADEETRQEENAKNEQDGAVDESLKVEMSYDEAIKLIPPATGSH